MRVFSCDVCRGELAFEDTACPTCESTVGFSHPRNEVVVLGEDDVRCANAELNGCNWIAEPGARLCFSCQLTRTRPNDQDATGLDLYREAEASKRHLLFELAEWGLPVVSRAEDPDHGLTFDLLSSENERVVTGHADGVITVDLAEGDDSHREQLRNAMDEPYRTMLGHFRHEIGHYYWMHLVADSDRLGRCRVLFGDDRIDYRESLNRHYAEGAPDGWQETHVSKYATMHPWEDFAETFAHYLHIRDTMQTAREFGLTHAANVEAENFATVVNVVWLPLSGALNQINRSMGKDDLYPFQLAAEVIEKLQFVAEVVDDAATAQRAQAMSEAAG